MKEISLKEMQKTELEMLIIIDAFCKKEDINYFLGCGCLAGAIIRKGFFPWDDDIDILMLREDYEKFIQKFKASNLKLLSCKNVDYYYPFAKVVSTKTVAYEYKHKIKDYGVYIDVFPLDGVPNNMKISKYLNRLKKYKYLMMSQWGCYLEEQKWFVKMVYKVLSLFTSFLPHNYFAKKLDKKCQKYSVKDCNKIGTVCHLLNENEIMDKKIFQSRVLVDFEGHKFYAPMAYKKYLNNLYGDYTKDSNHHIHKRFKAFWK